MWLPFMAGWVAAKIVDQFTTKPPAIAQHSVALGQGYTTTMRTSDNTSLGAVMYEVIRDGSAAVAIGYAATPEEAMLKARAAMAIDLANVKLNS